MIWKWIAQIPWVEMSIELIVKDEKMQFILIILAIYVFK